MKRIYVSAIVFVAIGCAAKEVASPNQVISPAVQGTLASVFAQKPVNSTGVKGSVSISLTKVASTAPVALALTGTVAPSVDVGGGITVTTAFLNIGGIKIKAEKDADASEKSFEKSYEDAKHARELLNSEKEKQTELDSEADKQLVESQIEAAKSSGDTVGAAQLIQDWKAKKVAAELIKASAEAAKEKIIEDAELAKEQQQDETLKWYGSFVYDAISNVLDKPLPSVDMFDGTYRRLKIKLLPNRVVDATNPLINNSIYISGTFTDGAGIKNFTFAYDRDLEIELKGNAGVDVIPNSESKVLIGFDIKKWFTGVDFSAAVPYTDGTIVIDKANNDSLMKQINKNIKRFSVVGNDDNKDGELAQDEESCDGAEAVTEEEANGQ